jgi:hypothetical protein
MPRRSNDFQRLIRHIFQQMAPAGARVTESALLPERTSSVTREIDVLIQHEVAGVEVAIAVECRDHARGTDVQWIDALIGKYGDLAIDRIVAVARKRFSKAAAAKAAAHRIETRTLRAALDTDWPSELDHVVFAQLQIQTRYNFVYATEPAWPAKAIPARLELDGNEVSKRAFEDSIVDELRDKINDEVHSRVGIKFLTPSDLDGILEQGFKITLPSAALITGDGRRFRVCGLTVHTHTDVSHKPVETRHELFGNVGVTTGTYELDSDGEVVEVSMIQPPGATFEYTSLFPLDSATKLPRKMRAASPQQYILFRKPRGKTRR